MANETNPGYLVQLQNPEGDNVYPVVSTQGIKNEDGSTFSPDDIAAKCKPYVSVTKPLLSGSVKAGDIVDYNDTNVIHETKTTYGQNTISHVAEAYTNGNGSVAPIPLGGNKFFIAYTLNYKFVYSIVKYTETVDNMNSGGALKTLTSGTISPTKRQADSFGYQRCTTDGSLPSTTEDQLFPLYFVVTMTYKGSSFSNNWLGILRINADYTTEFSEMDDVLSGGSNDYIVGATTLPNNGLLWLYYNNSDDVYKYKYKYYSVNWDTLSIELKYNIALDQSSRFTSLGTPYYDADTNKIFAWGDYGTRSSNTTPIAITIDATDFSTKPTAVRTSFSTWEDWYPYCAYMQKVGTSEYIFVGGRRNTSTPKMFPVKVKILSSGSVEANITYDAITDNSDAKDYNANAFTIGTNVVVYHYDTMKYYNSSFEVQKTLTFPDTAFTTSSERYLYPIKRLNDMDGFIVFENGTYYGTFSLDADNKFYTSIYTGSVGSDGIALNDAAKSEDVEVLISGTANMHSAKRGDTFDSSVGSTKNVYGYSTTDGTISAIQRSLLIPAGLGAYNFKKIPYNVTTSSDKYKVDISGYSTVIVYVNTDSNMVKMYLDATFSATTVDVYNTAQPLIDVNIKDVIQVLTGSVPIIIYPSIGFIQVPTQYHYTGSGTTMPWATIANGPITTVSAKSDSASTSTSIIIYAS